MMRNKHTLVFGAHFSVMNMRRLSAIVTSLSGNNFEIIIELSLGERVSRTRLWRSEKEIALIGLSAGLFKNCSYRLSPPRPGAARLLRSFRGRMYRLRGMSARRLIGKNQNGAKRMRKRNKLPKMKFRLARP